MLTEMMKKMLKRIRDLLMMMVMMRKTRYQTKSSIPAFARGKLRSRRWSCEYLRGLDYRGPNYHLHRNERDVPTSSTPL